MPAMKTLTAKHGQAPVNERQRGGEDPTAAGAANGK